MQIWVDADAFPGDVKALLFKAAKRTQMKVTFVANQPVSVPQSELFDTIRVAAGSDVADQEIVDQMQAGDLVITADIPLASHVIEKKGIALNPRGTLYTESNIGEKLAFRNLLDGLRGSGEITGGPSSFSDKNREAFANQLDRWLTAAQKQRGNH